MSQLSATSTWAPSHDPLVEDPVVVTKAVAVRGVAERGQRVEEARGEPAEAAVPEAGVPLRLAQVLERVAELLERLPALVGEVEVDQAVAERAADQILEREVVDALGVNLVVLVLRAEPALDHPVADCERQSHVRLPLAVDMTRQLGQRVLEVIEDRFLQRGGVHPGADMRRRVDAPGLRHRSGKGLDRPRAPGPLVGNPATVATRTGLARLEVRSCS